MRQRRRKCGALYGGVQLKAGGHRARAERTLNMSYMAVALEVLRLSGWLNADAPCRESKRGHARRSEVRAGEAGGRAAAAAQVWRAL